MPKTADLGLHVQREAEMNFTRVEVAVKERGVELCAGLRRRCAMRNYACNT